MQTIRVGILGCGGMGAYFAELINGKDGIACTAFCDAQLERARTICDKLDGQRATTEDAAILEADDIDAVFICSTHDVHAVQALTAARAGKHIFLEKPVALNAADARNVRNVVKQARIQFMTGYKLRYMTVVDHVRAFVSSPLATVGHNMEAPWKDGWKLDPVTGGGPLHAQGCHLVDLLCLCNPSRPVRVQAEGGPLVHGRGDLIDCAVATIRFESGAIASLSLGDAGAANVTSHFFCELFGGERSAALHANCFKASFWQKNPARAWDEDESQLLNIEDYKHAAFVREMQVFFAAIRGEQPLPFSVDDDIKPTLVIDAILRSIQTGQPVEI